MLLNSMINSPSFRQLGKYRPEASKRYSLEREYAVTEAHFKKVFKEMDYISQQVRTSGLLV